jgi:hypothetical protein
MDFKYIMILLCVVDFAWYQSCRVLASSISLGCVGVGIYIFGLLCHASCVVGFSTLPLWCGCSTLSPSVLFNCWSTTDSCGGNALKPSTSHNHFCMTLFLHKDCKYNFCAASFLGAWIHVKGGYGWFINCTIIKCLSNNFFLRGEPPLEDWFSALVFFVHALVATCFFLFSTFILLLW